MFKTKILTGLLLVAAVLFAQVGSALAAPQTQDATPIIGTIQDISTETDANGLTTVHLILTTFLSWASSIDSGA